MLSRLSFSPNLTTNSEISDLEFSQTFPPIRLFLTEKKQLSSSLKLGQKTRETSYCSIEIRCWIRWAKYICAAKIIKDVSVFKTYGSFDVIHDFLKKNLLSSNFMN